MQAHIGRILLLFGGQNIKQKKRGVSEKRTIVYIHPPEKYAEAAKQRTA